MAETQVETDALIEAARPHLQALGTLAQVGRLPEDTTLAAEVLDVLFDVNHSDPDQVGVGTLVVDGVKATRTINHGGQDNIIMVEVPGKGAWTFDGTSGILINQ